LKLSGQIFFQFDVKAFLFGLAVLTLSNGSQLGLLLLRR
jgi:hypothetical protein